MLDVETNQQPDVKNRIIYLDFRILFYLFIHFGYYLILHQAQRCSNVPSLIRIA